jgi:hypothetical protein
MKRKITSDMTILSQNKGSEIDSLNNKSPSGPLRSMEAI